MSDLSSQRVAILGGGIAGLAAAHRIFELAPNCRATLFEASDRLGGVVSTVERDGFQVERSADNFITTTPWGLDLCQRLGLTDRLIRTNPTYRRTYVVRKGKLHLLPDGFLMMAPTRLWPLVSTPILSPLGKLRAAWEYFVSPRRDESDESMASFVRRRLGRETYDRLIEPLISAVYAADMEKLSVAATLSRLRDMELEHGSLIRAMRKQARQNKTASSESGPRYSMFVTLRDGMTSIVDAIRTRLPADWIRTNCPVDCVAHIAGKWRLQLGESSQPKSSGVVADGSGLEFDSIIIATPSNIAARQLAAVDAELAGDLAKIERSGTAIVSLGYDERQVGHSLDGMGVVIPAIENSPLLACSFSSRKYPHRAPDGKTLLRVFVGGTRHPELIEMPDKELVPLVRKHLDPLLSIHGDPCFTDIARWPKTMPEYHVGHRGLVERIMTRTARLQRLELAGNSFSGVGIPDCIHSGERGRTNSCSMRNPVTAVARTRIRSRRASDRSSGDSSAQLEIPGRRALS